MAIFSKAGLYGAFLMAHVVVAVMWMGLLLFVNFVQTPAYAEMYCAARNNAFDRPTWALFEMGSENVSGHSQDSPAA